MRRGQLNFTEEEAATIREAERQAGFMPHHAAGAGPGVGGGLGLLGTIVGAVLTGVGEGLAELGHAIDNFFRTLFIAAGVAVAIGVIVFVLTHSYESTPPENTTQVEATAIRPEPGAQASQRYQFAPYEEPRIATDITIPEPTPAVVPVSLIEAQLKTLPLRRATPLFEASVAPPEFVAGHDPEPAAWESETDSSPVLRRKVFPDPGSPPPLAPVESRTECQVAPQSEIARPHAAVREVEDDEAEARPPQPQANKHKGKKPSRLSRVLSGVLTFEDFLFNQIDPMAEQ